MDADQFDVLTRDLAVVASRRRVLRRLAALPVVGALVGLVGAPEDAAAEHPVRRVQGRRDRRRQHRRAGNGKNKQRHQKRPGAGSRACADGVVKCCSPRFVADLGAVCNQEFGRYGPLGFCFKADFKCHPCGTQYDSEWTPRCNADFGACGGGGCHVFFER
jgi:hypothetical protein